MIIYTINKIMKKEFLTFLAFIFMAASMGCRNASTSSSDKSSDAEAQGTPFINFSEYEHDFGTVTEGEKVAYIFTFENTGTGNLVINSAVGSCGCTVPKYNNKPVPPGGKGNVEVVFDTSGRGGFQTKTITLSTNSSNPVTLLKISAEVIRSN